jgi:hypothetical protein
MPLNVKIEETGRVLDFNNEVIKIAFENACRMQSSKKQKKRPALMSSQQSVFV